MATVACRSFLSYLFFFALMSRSVPLSAFPRVQDPVYRILNPAVNCSDCRRVSNRIRQLQHLQRIKQRIMSAIRNNSDDAASADASPPVNSMLRSNRSSHQMSSSIDSSLSKMESSPNNVKNGNCTTDCPTRTKEISHDAVGPSLALVTEKEISLDAIGPSLALVAEKEVSHEAIGPSLALVAEKSTRLVDVNSSFEDTSTSSGQKMTEDLRGEHSWNDTRGNDGGKLALMDISGPRIVSFSRVLSSGKRKHVLQFSLSPTAHIEDLRVVKAHLWLLLIRRPSPGDKPEADKATGHEATDSNDDLRTTDGKGNNSSSSNSSHEVKQKSDSSNDDKAILRVLLISDDGTKRLMTYLRTVVKMTHWQKIRLPVQVIQEQLFSDHPTLTLMIRCRHCGGAVRIAFPHTAAHTKQTRQKRRKRKRKQRDNSKNQSRQRVPIYGSQIRWLSKYSLLDLNIKKFRPSPFLVINTCLRAGKHR